jgi:uncharacterized protein (TIGR00255 family)
MLHSMTAYAKAEKTDDEFAVSVEIRSYNSRYLDMVLRAPHGYHILEEKIKRTVEERLARGRVEVTCKISEKSDEAYAFEIDVPKARAYYECLVRLKNLFHIQAEIPIELMASHGGVIKPADVDRDMNACWAIVGACLDAAINDIIAMRKQEGDFIAVDILKRLAFIEESILQIEKESSDLLLQYQERLKDRLAVLTKGVVDIDPDRIAQEAAFLADKSDISEEIVRVKSHLGQGRDIINAAEPAGQKLNFLLQELRREFNTIGAKTEKVGISHIVIAAKAELEKIREQVQNVE